MVRDKEVTCYVHDIDRYKRLVAVCSVPGVSDINAELVKNGFAVAYRNYSTDYVDEEEAARGVRAGLWAGEFETPLPLASRKPSTHVEWRFEMPWDWPGNQPMIATETS